MDHRQVAALLCRLPRSNLPPPLRIDLRQDDDGVYFSPPDDQGRLHSSSAFTCLALVEYFQRRTLGRIYEGSPLFLFQMARKMVGSTGNTAVGIRATLKTLRRYGAPPIELKPYSDQCLDTEMNDVSLLGFAKELDGTVYFRLDSGDHCGPKLLTILKSFLAARFPATLGFHVPRSMTSDGVIPFRPTFDSYRAGQSVLAVGYDDERLPGKQGAVLIRNSWGTKWGEAGYGWLPYSYFAHNLIADLWTLGNIKWMQSTELEQPQKT